MFIENLPCSGTARRSGIRAMLKKKKFSAIIDIQSSGRSFPLIKDTYCGPPMNER